VHASQINALFNHKALLFFTFSDISKEPGSVCSLNETDGEVFPSPDKAMFIVGGNKCYLRHLTDGVTSGQSKQMNNCFASFKEFQEFRI